jgi:hypothetical protein
MRRPRDVQRRARLELLWMLAGFVIVQAGIGLAVDQFWGRIRDLEFDGLLRQLQTHRAEATDRPLVPALGSSRTMAGLRPDRLSCLGPAGPLVHNCGVVGCGPMMEQIVLRRLLDAGIRPALLFVEVMPMSLSWRDGSPIEEREHGKGRFTAAEVALLLPYYQQPHRLLWSWSAARLLPCDHHQGDLHAALGIDLPSDGSCESLHVDRYGWRCWLGAGPEIAPLLVRTHIERYAAALAEPAVAPGPLHALRDLLRLCQTRQIPVVLVIPPEGSAFRGYRPAAEQNHIRHVAALACEFRVPLVDARAWVSDDGFADGHHLTPEGAEVYTQRFGREALLPHLKLIGPRAR